MRMVREVVETDTGTILTLFNTKNLSDGIDSLNIVSYKEAVKICEQVLATSPEVTLAIVKVTDVLKTDRPTPPIKHTLIK